MSTPRYDEDSPNYTSPWGWWFNGDRGKGTVWPDPRNIATTKPAGTKPTDSGTDYRQPPAGKGMTIYDMHDAVQELERLHPDRAGVGFHAGEIVIICGRRSTQSVDSLLTAAIERGLLRLQKVRTVNSNNRPVRIYSTPQAMQARKDATGAAPLPPTTRDAILVLLASSDNNQGTRNDLSILEIAGRLDLSRASVEKIIAELLGGGLVSGYRKGQGKTKAWTLTDKGLEQSSVIQSRISAPAGQQNNQVTTELPAPPTEPVDKVALVVSLVGKLEAAGMQGRVLPKDILSASPNGYIDTIYKHLQAAVKRGILYCASMRLRERGNRMCVVYSLNPIEVPAELAQTTEQMITEALQGSEEGLRLGELVRRARLSESSMRITLERMVDDGVIDMVGLRSHSRYQLRKKATALVAHDLQTT